MSVMTLVSIFLFMLCSLLPGVEHFHEEVKIKKVEAGEVFPQDFRSPLGIPLILSGTFGELRNNHFHAGLDCKTNGTENYRIYSIAEGYVSRIKVSPRGYGNALYIDHPNGYTSVYAHLNEFKDNIGAYLKKIQYENNGFEQDITLPPGVLPVFKGQVVALSGNTGGSGGPHLHFEVRDTRTQEALNPLLFGFKVVDTRKPLISGMAVYNFDQNNQHTQAKGYDPKAGSSGKYALSSSTITVGSPRIGLGIKAYDKQNGASNLNGVFSIDMVVDGQSIYAFQMDRIAFDQSRYLNSHVDYQYKAKGKGWMQKCFRDPGNHLAIYDNNVGDGILDLSNGQVRKVVFHVRDVAGNLSTLAFNVKYDPNKSFGTVPQGNSGHTFRYDSPNSFNGNGLVVNFPQGAFYENFGFNYSTRTSTSEYVYSNYHKLHNKEMPVHKYYDVLLDGSRVPDRLRDKVLVAYKKGSKTKSAGGTWEGSYLKGSAKEFGEFYITVDTRPPTIRPINISDGKSLAKNSTITFTISDNLSGIKSYNGYVDGQWVLMQYDQKTARLRYRFDSRVGRGKHKFRLEVVDARGNVATYNANFTR